MRRMTASLLAVAAVLLFAPETACSAPAEIKFKNKTGSDWVKEYTEKARKNEKPEDVVKRQKDAVTALGALGPGFDKGIDTVGGALSHKSDDVRHMAVRSMAGFGAAAGKYAKALVSIGASKSEPSDIRKLALDALRRAPATDLKGEVKRIGTLMDDADDKVRSGAAVVAAALREFAPPGLAGKAAANLLATVSGGANVLPATWDALAVLQNGEGALPKLKALIDLGHVEVYAAAQFIAAMGHAKGIEELAVPFQAKLAALTWATTPERKLLSDLEPVVDAVRILGPTRDGLMGLLDVSRNSIGVGTDFQGRCMDTFAAAADDVWADLLAQIRPKPGGRTPALEIERFHRALVLGGGRGVSVMLEQWEDLQLTPYDRGYFMPTRLSDAQRDELLAKLTDTLLTSSILRGTAPMYMLTLAMMQSPVPAKTAMLIGDRRNDIIAMFAHKHPKALVAALAHRAGIDKQLDVETMRNMADANISTAYTWDMVLLLDYAMAAPTPAEGTALKDWAQTYLTTQASEPGGPPGGWRMVLLALRLLKAAGVRPADLIKELPEGVQARPREVLAFQLYQTWPDDPAAQDLMASAADAVSNAPMGTQRSAWQAEAFRAMCDAIAAIRAPSDRAKSALMNAGIGQPPVGGDTMRAREAYWRRTWK